MMSVSNKKISIVTVVYNDAKNIKTTLESCFNQTYANKELIIIDGGSNDGTLDVINQFKDKINSIVSEPDKGIYDAMNKGIDLATGEWIIFMNSGDSFYNNDVLSDIFKLNLNCDLIYGKNKCLYSYFTRINSPLPIGKISEGMIFSHQSMLVKTKLMKENKFNLKYKISADFNFIYYLYKNNYVFKEINLIISKVTAGGTSEVNLIHTHLERKNISLSYEKGLKKFILASKYNLVSIKILLIKLIKMILPKRLIEKITKMKYN